MNRTDSPAVECRLDGGVRPLVEKRDIVLRLLDEADLCLNDGADDIAALLYEAASALRVKTNDEQFGRMWRADSSLKSWFPLTAERLEALERWARDCRDLVLLPAAQQDDSIGREADGLGQALVAFSLRPNVF